MCHVLLVELMWNPDSIFSKNALDPRLLLLATNGEQELKDGQGKTPRKSLIYSLTPPRAIWDSFSEKENFTTFALSIFYNCWQFQNDRIFTQKSSILTATSHLDRMVTEFTNFLNFNPTFNVEEEEKWSPPATSMWKVNCDASYKDGSAALGMVIRD